MPWVSDIYAEVGDDDTDNGDGGSGNSAMARDPMAHPLILQTLSGTVAFVHHLLQPLVHVYSFLQP